MQPVRLPEFEPVSQNAADIEEQTGPDHAPEGAGTVDEQGKPEGVGGVEDQVMPDLGYGDQDHQKGKEQRIAVHLPVEEEKDARKDDAQQGEKQ